MITLPSRIHRSGSETRLVRTRGADPPVTVSAIPPNRVAEDYQRLFVDVDGGNLGYETTGTSGPLLVLIPGIGNNQMPTSSSCPRRPRPDIESPSSICAAVAFRSPTRG